MALLAVGPACNAVRDDVLHVSADYDSVPPFTFLVAPQWGARPSELA